MLLVLCYAITVCHILCIWHFFFYSTAAIVSYCFHFNGSIGENIKSNIKRNAFNKKKKGRKRRERRKGEESHRER